MRKGAWLIAVVLVAAVALAQQKGGEKKMDQTAQTRVAAERQIMAVLDRMARTHQTYLSVPADDGRALRLLAETSGAKHAVEIGTSTGYSGLWICLGMLGTGGRLTTFEIDRERAAEARQHFREAGVEQMVTVTEGDAHQQLSKITGPIDYVFIDAEKEGYTAYLRRLLPLVRPGGLILAHNVNMVPDYVKAVKAIPELETIFFMQGEGLAVTVKKR